MAVATRVAEFCERYGLDVPILQAPMAGACPPELAVAVAEAGGMGAAGAVLDHPDRIREWVRRFREGSSRSYQINLWIPDPPAVADTGEQEARRFLERFGDPGEAGGSPPSFDEQCEELLAASPTAISSIMGVFEPAMVERMHAAGVAWFACATTLEEALEAERAGADVVVAQGIEAGGHRGTFDPDAAGRTAIGLVALVPQLVDALTVPVVATGGIADGRAVAAALALGASAVQVGTAYLRSPEVGIAQPWSEGLAAAAPETSVLTRAYSGRPGRALPTAFVRSWSAPDAPPPARYPVQRRLVAQWRRGRTGSSGPGGVDAVNQWAGQAARLARAEPAGAITTRLWQEARQVLGVEDGGHRASPSAGPDPA
ncbi:NAD(P)H-dependent flavin oxidoreductase [Actinomycetospora cinnamomea]|uniref:Propionate 3-nitronate monooxygenase n=1 Tax=Actinomycetospora cinnamomea TaxID=663609 RepID=A0A2U1FRJ8_9PSEU|nr:nitronate monooxygenase [Actinomycetospora cinnamomea]PVZ14797.1 nitronate monooxygenase [Actinomycetospora cinnamomea]